jgi:hypothetical protein
MLGGGCCGRVGVLRARCVDLNFNFVKSCGEAEALGWTGARRRRGARRRVVGSVKAYVEVAAAGAKAHVRGAWRRQLAVKARTGRLRNDANPSNRAPSGRTDSCRAAAASATPLSPPSRPPPLPANTPPPTSAANPNPSAPLQAAATAPAPGSGAAAAASRAAS